MPKAPVKKTPAKKQTKTAKRSGPKPSPGPSESNDAASAPAAKSPSKGRRKKSGHVARDVIYDKVDAQLYDGDNPLTAEMARKLLGWVAESENVKFGGDYLIADEHGVKVRCHNNVTNRPLYNSVVETLKQEILRGRWRFNGEPFIIGKTGLVLNGQHSMVALVLAAQEWEEKAGQYKDVWKTEPTIDKLVVFGVDEDDDVVNTMDTCKPRTLADVIYRSEFFADLGSKDRKAVARITDYAVRLLWHRTGAGLDAFAPRRTHAESLDFITRHPKLLEAVRHIHEENGGDSVIARFISPGDAAGMLYMMGCCTTERETDDGKGYSQVKTPTEKYLDWSMWEKACEFWVLLGAGNTDMKPIREAMAAIANETDGGIINRDERCAVIAKAWNIWSGGKKLKTESLALEYTKDSEGVWHLGETPDVGGIDLGNPY